MKDHESINLNSISSKKNSSKGLCWTPKDSDQVGLCEVKITLCKPIKLYQNQIIHMKFYNRAIQ